MTTERRDRALRELTLAALEFRDSEVAGYCEVLVGQHLIAVAKQRPDQTREEWQEDVFGKIRAYL
jgi:hypothetical protein